MARASDLAVGLLANLGNIKFVERTLPLTITGRSAWDR